VNFEQWHYIKKQDMFSQNSHIVVQFHLLVPKKVVEVMWIFQRIVLRTTTDIYLRATTETRITHFRLPEPTRGQVQL
jgi:hypothetical protein